MLMNLMMMDTHPPDLLLLLHLVMPFFSPFNVYYILIVVKTKNIARNKIFTLKFILMLQKLTAKISGQCFSKRNGSSAVIPNQLIKATGPNLPSKQLQQTVNDLRTTLPSALDHFKRTGYDEKTDLVFPVKSEYLSDIALEKEYKEKTYHVSFYFNSTTQGVARYRELSSLLNGGGETIKCVHEPFLGRSKISIEIVKPITENGDLKILPKVNNSYLSPLLINNETTSLLDA